MLDPPFAVGLLHLKQAGANRAANGDHLYTAIAHRFVIPLFVGIKPAAFRGVLI